MEQLLKEKRTHRVGTITLGVSLILFGALYLLRLFMPDISILFIFHLWPVALVALGLEVLLAGLGRADFVIDKAAVVLLFIMLFFILGMAGAEWFMQNIKEFI